MSAVTSHSFITRPGQEELLLRELLHWHPDAKVEVSGPGLVTCRGVDLPSSPLFFSRQLLPESTRVRAASVREWVDEVFKYLKEHFQASPPAWILHIVAPAATESGESGARPTLIRDELLKKLKEKQRSYLRALDEQSSPASTLVQVCLFSTTDGVISICSGTDRKEFGTLISPYPAGYVDIADDKTPPSRAFKKLLEAQSVFDLPFKRDERCVDLGASPGGWTHVLLANGCAVTAIDRSPLIPPLMKHKRLRFETGNAFVWSPPEPVDWLVCDVITTPDRTVALIRKWVEERLCAQFCVTVKFKGDPIVEPLFELTSFLRESTQWFDGKQLTNNKNEVTVVGKVLEAGQLPSLQSPTYQKRTRRATHPPS